MFNLVTRQDFFDIAVKIERKGFSLPRFGVKNQIRRKWNSESSAAGSFWDFPWLEGLWNREITGDESAGYREWLAKTFCPDQSDALSVGCGDGSAEEKWFRTGQFRRVTGLDIADERIRKARDRFNNLNPGLQFVTGDFLTDPVDDYQVLIFEHAFHHLFPMDKVIRKVKEALQPGKQVLMIDYFGPDRFQWEKELLQEANEVLASWPDEWKRIPGTTRTKNRIGSPGLLRMRWSDPSEAAESAGSIQKLRANFNIRFEKVISGTLLHVVFKDIAGNFMSEETRPAVLEVLNREKKLIESGRVNGHFRALVIEGRQ